MKPSSLSINMRAIALLCLLHAAFGKYSWDGPGVTEPANGGSVQSNECGTDNGSCHCCLMRQELTKMTERFETDLDELEEEYSKTMQSLQDIKASRTAFSVSVANYDKTAPEDRTIVYAIVSLNMGDAYDETSGIFTVPHTGVYSLALTVYDDAGASDSPLSVCAVLQVNGKDIVGTTDQNNNDQHDSSSFVVALHLMAGDRVAVVLPANCRLSDDNSQYNTFSGFLLHVTG